MARRTVSQLLKGFDPNAQEQVLTPEMSENLEVVDLTSALRGDPPKAPEIRKVSPTAPKQSFGDRIKESLGAEGMNFGEIISSPGVQGFLGALAQGMSGGEAGGEVGAMLGQFGSQQAQARATQNFASRLLAGEDPSQIEGLDVAGITPEGIQQAEQIRQARVDEEMAREGLAIDERRTAVQEKAQKLRERGFEVEEEQWERFGQRETEIGLEMAEQELERFERTQDIQERVDLARAGLMEAQAQALQNEAAGETSPQLQATLINRTQEMIGMIGETLQEERSALRSAERRLQTAQQAVAEASRGWFGGERTPPKELVELQEGAQAIVDATKDTITQLESSLNQAQRVQNERLGITPQEGEDTGTEGTEAGTPPATPPDEEEGTIVGDGTLQNPIDLSNLDTGQAEEAILNMAPGTYGIRNGRIIYMDENGEPQF